VDLFEHQAKELFAEYGVPVPAGKIATTPEEARAIAEEFAAAGTSRVVVKAQVKAGGRGKAGGVKVADSPADAEEKARQILGMDIKGHTVHKVLVEEASAIAQEFYFSFLLDRANRTFLSICSVEGGMEIEEVAATKPDAVAQIPIAALNGVDRARAREIAADPHAGRQGHRARRQGHPRRQRRVPPARARGAGGRRLRRPARGQGQGEGPQLRQARRLGRHHRQRRRPGHVHARRRRVRR